MTPPSKREKKNPHIKDIILLLAVPIAIIIAAAAVIYVPRFAANPKYDFVYAACGEYRCTSAYAVKDGRVVEREFDEAGDFIGSTASATLYYFDIENNTSRPMSFEEARSLRLNPSSKSPDGYTLSREYENSGFLFWRDYSQDWYLKDGAKKKEVQIQASNAYYSDNITFLGWIET